jgi:RHS repeat-associated protein
MAYDLANQRTSVTNPLNNRVTTVYDAAGGVLALVNPLAYRTTFGFDKARQRVRVQDAKLNITTSVFDPAGRPVATIDAMNFRTTQVYDAASRMTALVDANAHRVSFQYDTAGQNTAVRDPLLRRTTFTYTTTGQRASRWDARQNRTTYSYDPLDRLVGRKYSDGTRSTFAYDLVDNRTLMADSTGRTTSTFDALNRPQIVVNPAGARISYSYTPIGLRAGMQAPGGRYTYSYDAAGRTHYLVNPLLERTTFGWDSAGQLKTQTLANTTRASLSYDAAGQITFLANLTSSGSALSSFTYTYDKVGNRTRVVEAGGTRTTWSYDKNYRLTNENRNGTLTWASFTPDQWSEFTPNQWAAFGVSGAGATYNVTHTYDPVGNRLVQNSAGQLTTFTYDIANQLATSVDAGGRTTYTFDATGNLALQAAPGGRTTYAWDIESRLTQLWLPAGVVNTMIYNADGVRMGKTDSAGTEKFVWDMQNLLLETDISNITQAAYTSKPDHFGSLISQRRGASSSFHHFDALGSTMGLTDVSQNLTDAYLYQAYGAAAGQFGSTVNPFQWVGKLGYFLDSDPAQYHIRARNYQPALARFLSTDPMRFWAGDSNLYRYCGNRPVIFADPSGKFIIIVVGVVIVVYLLIPDTANAPAPGDRTYASDPYAGMPYAAAAGVAVAAAPAAVNAIRAGCSAVALAFARRALAAKIAATLALLRQLEGRRDWVGSQIGLVQGEALEALELRAAQIDFQIQQTEQLLEMQEQRLARLLGGS